MSKLTVVFKVDVSKRNKLGQFHKEVVKVCEKNENEYVQVALFKLMNNDKNHKYVLGNIKESELNG